SSARATAPRPAARTRGDTAPRRRGRRGRRRPAARVARLRRRRSTRSAQIPRSMRTAAPARRREPQSRSPHTRRRPEGGARDSIYTEGFTGDSSMRQRRHLPRAVLTAARVMALAAGAAAQTGRVGGTVKDEAGQPIKGATITAENPAASPSSFTATTDDKGRFSIIGLRGGQWTFSAQAPGFGPESGRPNVRTIGQPT